MSYFLVDENYGYGGSSCTIYVYEQLILHAFFVFEL